MAMRTLLALAALVLAISCIRADDNKPSFPQSPIGFDDGRAELEKNLGSLTLTSLVVERALEDATSGELADLLARRVALDELASMDTLLELKGELAKQTSADGMQKTLEAAKLGHKDVSKALGSLLTRRNYTPLEAAAWLYARNFNSRAIVGALDRGTNAARKVRAFLESSKEATADALFERAFWEFDLRDASGIAGGHYDTAQLLEAMFEIGVDFAAWSQALGKSAEDPLSADEKRVIEWGDAGVMAPALEGRVSERDLYDAALAYLHAQTKAGKSLEGLRALALRRSYVAQRWFRTGGTGVIGVYRGPWNPKSAAPTVTALGLGDLDGIAFAQGLNEELRSYFTPAASTLTLVIYEDGSARGLLKTAQTYKYEADTPLGKGQFPLLMLEGRATQRGKSVLMAPVFTASNKLPFAEFEVSGFGLTTNKAFMYGEANDGKNDWPLLLRRITRNAAID